MAFGSHLQEDAEDVEGQAGDDDVGDDPHNDVAEVVEEPLHRFAFKGARAEPQYKGEDKGCGHGDECRHLDCEIGGKGIAHVHIAQGGKPVAQDMGIGQRTREIGERARKDSGAVCHGHGDEQQSSCAHAQLGYAGRLREV